MDHIIPKIIVSGSIAIDRIMHFPGRYRDLIIPEKIDSLSVSVLLDKQDVSRGGVGANIAYSLAKLGEKPILLVSVGGDASDYVNDLKEMGVDTSYMHHSKLTTASFSVITDNEHNQVAGFYEGAMADSDSLHLNPWINEDVIIVIAANNPTAMNRNVTEARRNNIRYVYDPSQQVSEPTINLEEGVDGAEILFANDYEMGLICKRLSTTIDELNKRVPIIVTTHGKDGSLITGSRVDKAIQVGRANTDAIDPTGAGDAYRAGFLYAYVRGHDLLTCGQLGSTVASFVVEKNGTQQSFTASEIIDRYKENFNEEIEL